jgi:phosphate-selective porin OprO/OprP
MKTRIRVRAQVIALAWSTLCAMPGWSQAPDASNAGSNFERYLAAIQAQPLPAADPPLPVPAAPVEQPKTEIAPPPEDPLKPKFELRGRIHADAIFVNQSPTNKQALGNIDNVTGFRRARLGAQGVVGDNVNWLSEFDFAGGTINFRDVYVELNELPWINRFRIGHFREPFSLEGQASANQFPLVERSPINALDPSRNWGVGIFSYTENQRMTFAAGAFRSGTSNSSGDDIEDGDDMAYTFRITALPWYDVDSDHYRLMHVGGAFSQRRPKDGILTINEGPQSTLLTVSDNPGSPFVPKITIPASQNQLYNVQWALALDAFAIQAEWYGTGIDQIGGGPIFLSGSYGFMSYFLTGEHLTYDRKEGRFGITHVLSPFVTHSGRHFSCQGVGAWELMGRLAYSNFQSPNMPLSPNGQPQGDRLWEFTCGVNWYLNDNVRFMFNYVHAVPIIQNVGSSDADGFFIRTSIWW